MAQIDAPNQLVSIIIPTYNAADYVIQTLDSVLGQTYRKKEIIVVDDGSTDDTEQLLIQFQERIQLIKQENFGGPSGPRNVGLSKSKGDYVAIFDSDDLMKPDKIALQVDILDKLPLVDLVFTDFTVIDEVGSVLRESFLESYISFRNSLSLTDIEDCYLISGDDLFYSLLRSNFIGTSSVVARKAVLEEADGFDQSLLNGDDIDLWYRLARTGSVFAFVDRPLHFYRRRKGSISRRGSHRYPFIMRVINRQLPFIKSESVKRHVLQKLLSVKLGYAFALLEENNAVAALDIYREILPKHPSWHCVRGWLLSKIMSIPLLNKWLYPPWKSLRNRGNSNSNLE